MHVEAQKLHEIRFIESSGELIVQGVRELMYSISDIRIPVHLISYDLNKYFVRIQGVFLKLERIYKMRNIFQAVAVVSSELLKVAVVVADLSK